MLLLQNVQEMKIITNGETVAGDNYETVEMEVESLDEITEACLQLNWEGQASAINVNKVESPRPNEGTCVTLILQS